MNISIEQLIELIVKQVVAELTQHGVEIDFGDEKKSSSNTKVEIDMSCYKTPVLTENNSQLNFAEREIIVPKKTVITPGAREIIKKKKLIVTHKTN
jgi:hypothetical protein